MAAINKRKMLESAQRNLQKGALDKALKDYQTILEADPRDANVRLKLGDLQLRAGKNDEAITAYLKVADQFMRDGFDAKAVAIYKQITKIDTKRQDIYVPLADLYQRLGLVSEAMAALQTAADSYHRDGRKREALDLLRRMASLDPSNTTSRLKVAELLQQEGLTDEALAEYREAAAEFERQGDWEARVGVLQRVLELHPGDVEALAVLAEVLVDRNQARRAEGFVRKLVDADPGRPESHELLARVLTDLGHRERAVDSYRHAAEAWRARGDEDRARAILQRFVPAEPFAPDSDPGAREAGAAESPFGSEGLGGESFALDGHGFSGVGHDELESEEPGERPEPEPPPLPPRAAATRPELDPRPARKPAPAPKAKAASPGAAPAKAAVAPARPTAASAGPAPAKPVPAAAKPAAKPAAPAAPTKPVAAPAKPAAAAAKPAAAPAKPAAAAKPAGAQQPASEAGGGDIDQLLAEAGVYLRYGKHERAIASLDSVLAREPEHPLALEQLGEALAASGENERAVETWLSAARAARAADDTERFDSVVRRIAAVDAAAAASIAPEPAPDASDAGEAPADAAAFDDIEIDVDPASFGDEVVEEELAPPIEEGGDGVEIEIDPGALGEAVEADAGAIASEAEEEITPPEAAAPLEEPSELEASESAPEIEDEPELEEESEPEAAPELAFDEAAESEPDEVDATPPSVWELPPEEDEVAAAPPAPTASAPPGELSSATTQQILEEFEEAGFYFEQGLFDEAETIYQRILERAPNHPGALLRLGEIAVQRGRDPGAGVALESDATDSTEQALAAAGKPARGAATPEPAAPLAEAPDIEPPDETDLTDRAMGVGEVAWHRAGAEASALAAQPAPPAVAPPAAAAPGAEAAKPKRVEAPAPAVAAAPEEPELTTPEVAQEGGGVAFDLAAELSEALASPAKQRSATDEDGFESVFREFKRGVSQTLGEGDVETHFDLGIAYREMGLFDDAIGEFRYALGLPARRLDGLSMMGLCALDLGRPQDAVGHFEQALASPDVPGEREAALRFDLGRAYQALGDRERALGAFRRVVELDATFQDAAQRLAAIEAGDMTPPKADGDEAYESFDDLIAESAESEQPAPEPAPAYESFDDVVAEAAEEDARESAAQASGDAVEAESEAERRDGAAERAAPAPSEASAPAAEPAESEANQPEPAPATPKRRRKVSFF